MSKKFGRTMDLRSRARLCGSWRLLALMVLGALTIPATQATQTTEATRANDYECCPEKAHWLNPSLNCSDGSVIRLNCSGDESFFSLDPAANHFDEFYVEDGHLQFIHSYDPVLPGRFCVSGKGEKERWALVCFDEDDQYEPSGWRSLMFGILCLLSTMFLALTLAVYAVLPELREIQDKAMFCVTAFLASGYVCLAIQQLRPHPPDDDPVCVPLAFSMYWTLLSAFFWMNLVSFNVWRTVWFKNFPIKDKDLFVVYCGVGFVGPGFFLIAALATHHTEGYHLKPRFGETKCWFGGDSETWAFFYGPIAALLALNVVYLGLTCWRLWVDYKGYTGCGLRSLRYNCALCVKLVLVMGISWIFEVISFAAAPPGDSLHWIVTDILNSLQGVFIFILLVLRRKRVKMLLARRKPFGISFPKSWSAYNDEDAEAPPLDVEMELSNAQ